MRKLVGMLAMLVMVVSLVGVLASCSVAEYEYGDFTYTKGKNSNVLLTGFSAQGKEKELIVIPETIKGLKVTGVYSKGSFLGVYEKKFYSDNLKKVYISFNFYYQTYPFEEIVTLTKTILTSNTDNLGLFGGGGQDEYENYVSHVYIMHIPENNNRTGWEYEALYANISYMWNYEIDTSIATHRYYWIDDEDYGETIKFIPDNPVRARV